MASVKMYLRESTVAGNGASVCFRVIHERKVAVVNTGVKATGPLYEALSSSSSLSTLLAKPELSAYSSRIAEVERVGRRLEMIARGMDRSRKTYSVRDVIDRYNDADTVVGLISFGRRVAKDLRSTGKISSADHVERGVNKFENFVKLEGSCQLSVVSFQLSDVGCQLGTGASPGEQNSCATPGRWEVGFDEVDGAMIRRYEKWLKGEGLCPNTTSYYLRKLRSIYNQAVDQGLARPKDLFKKVFTGVAKTTKRAIPLEVVKRLKRLKLNPDSPESVARDMFLFSFYTRGMSTIDMAFLRKADLKNGVLTYRRRKTSQTLNIKWEPAMQRIVERRGKGNSKYMLPLIREEEKDARRQYLNASHFLNRHLKHLGEMLGLEMPLTMYVARHAWASIARANDVPLSVISEGMGHDSEKTTRIYLASLDDGRIDSANRAIIALV